MICNNIIVNGVSKSFPLNTTAWKEFSVMETLDIPIQKPDMKRMLSLNIDAEIIDFEVATTPVTSLNPEGVISTGYKLIVRGKLIQFIEYIADNCEQSTHSAHYEVPFCTYIILPEYYEEGNSINVNVIVEDVFIEQTSCRNFFKNVTLLAYADICCGVADVRLPKPVIVLTGMEDYIVTEPSPYVFNIEVSRDNLQQSVFIAAIPGGTIVLGSELPEGYTYSNGELVIEDDAVSDTLSFLILAEPCSVPFTINVDIKESPKVSMYTQTAQNTTVIEVSKNIFDVEFTLGDGDGISGFIVKPYENLTLITALPAGYTYADNIIVTDQTATNATLEFEVGQGKLATKVEVNFTVIP